MYSDGGRVKRTSKDSSAADINVSASMYERYGAFVVLLPDSDAQSCAAIFTVCLIDVNIVSE